ncbi:hypothetical protein ACGFNY_34990 [Streptomyces chartreusis]|uniref:hypothetical protein n=1 Tax=Streptomyces chartreusis TaxID=1969 RepID=UPI00371C67D0
MPERPAADLAALALLALPADESGAMSDHALPPHMSLKFVILRHLTGPWPASGMPSTPKPARPDS